MHIPESTIAVDRYFKRRSGVLSRVTPNINIHTEPGKIYPATGKFTGIGVFTIVEAKDGWSRLKSRAGRICMEFCELV